MTWVLQRGQYDRESCTTSNQYNLKINCAQFLSHCFVENISIPPSKELDFDLPGFNQPPSLVTLVVDHRIPEKGQKILLWPLFGFSYPDSPFKIPIRPLPPQTGTQGGTFKFLDVLKFHSLFPCFVQYVNETREDIQTRWIPSDIEHFRTESNSRFLTNVCIRL